MCPHAGQSFKKWPAAVSHFVFFCLLCWGSCEKLGKGHHKQTQLLSPAVRSNKEALAVLRVPKFHQSFASFTLTPLETLSGSHFSLKHLTHSWLMGQHCTGQPITLHFMKWMHRPYGITVRRPALAYTQRCMQCDPRTEINSLPVSFITAGTVPINFKSLSGTWSICPSWIYGACMQAI